MQKLLLIVFFLFLASVASAQNYPDITRRIDSLVKIDLPKSALKEADSLYWLARKSNNAPQEIKAAMYRMKLQSTGSEATFVVVIDTLKHEIQQSAYPVKPVLLSLLAGTYRNYFNYYRYTFYQRSRLEKPGTDFTKWDMQTINSEIARLFDLSLQDYKKEQQTPVDGFENDLIGDKNERYWRPTLYDLLLQEALGYFLNEESAINNPKMPFTLNDPRLFGDSRAFANLVISTTDTTSSFYSGIKYLQQATLFHLQKPNDEALAAIDLQRLGFLYTHSSPINKNELYLGALKQIATIYATKPISADALVLLGNYYKNNGRETNNLITAVDYYNKAVTAFPQSIGGINAAGYLKGIKRPNISANLEKGNIPGKPLLGLLSYQNIGTARVTVYKVPEAKGAELDKNLPSIYYNNKNYSADSVVKYLRKLNPVQDDTLHPALAIQDYKPHTTEFKINALPTGHYVLVMRDNLQSDSNSVQITTFKVSSLSLLSRHIDATRVEIRVMDRETGAPLSGVTVTLAGYYRGKTNSQGSCIIKDVYSISQFSVMLTTKTDTLFEPAIYSPIRSVQQTIVTRTVLFTDRQLYRQGQTVYYKGIQLQIQNDKSSIITNAPLHVDVKDNNRKSITTADVATNEFGTFSGSFVLPQNILNGSVNISTPNGSKQINVEEYKRPSFQAEFLPIKESYKPGDSVVVKGHVMAYSGNGLSMARIVYHITGSLYPRWQPNIDLGDVGTDTIKSDAQGNFKIKFKTATYPDIDTLESSYYNYSISAAITDESGETKQINTDLKVCVDNIDINARVPRTVFAQSVITASIKNMDNILESGTLQMTIYPVTAPATLYKNRLWADPDQYLLSRQEYARYFPDYAYGNEDNESSWAVKTQVYDTTLTTDGKAAVLKFAALKTQPTGYYKLTINARNEAGDTTSTDDYFYLVNEPAAPKQFSSWVIAMGTNMVNDITTASFLVGIGKTTKILVEKNSGGQIASSKWITLKGDKQQIIKVPVTVGEKNVSVSFFMVWQNREYTSTQNIKTKAPDNGLDIKFLTFRDNLQPGQKEQWKIQVTGKSGEKEAVEMLAGMYDASLDALGGSDDWASFLNINNRSSGQSFGWDDGFIRQLSTTPLKQNTYYYFGSINRSYEQFGVILPANERMLHEVTINGTSSIVYKTDTVEYRAADYKVRDNSSVDDLLKHMEGFEVGADGSITSQGQAITRARLNGRDYAGADLSAAIKNLPADIVEKIQVVDDYGDQAGRTGIKDGDPEKILNITVSRPVIPRTNFNETAFFYPQLHTDSAGQIVIDFTIPESLTQWKFRALAHTKDLKTGYIEREIVTQKQLSITANMPRFLREGDTITVSARLTNLTAGELKGHISLQLLNALTAQKIALLQNPAEGEQDFDIAAASTRAVSFKLIIPAGLDALTYRLTAESGDFSDGEENTLPVLPNRMLVTESMPMMVRAGQTKSFSFDKLVNQSSTTIVNKSLTLEYTQNPAWYAVQALPYMMEFPYECSEQVFSRYYANSLAANLVKTMPVIKQVFDQWKSANSPQLLSNLEKNQELKATLIEETPWLRETADETEQKKRIALLFDLNKMSYELQQNLNKLKDRQLPDGGFPWFGGDKSDAYITRYILAGIGQLFHAGVADLKDKTLKSISDKAMDYLDNVLVLDAARQKEQKTYDNRILNSTEIHEWYTKSYYTNRVNNEEIQALLANYLTLAQKQWNTLGVYEQGMIALTMLRNNKADVAQMIINSLKETAQQSDDMGMYWAKNQLGYFWNESPIETQSLMIELFTEARNQQKAIEEMKIWLLRNKQTSDWKTTKATAQACYALLMKGDSLLTGAGTSTIKLNGKPITELKPDVKADAGTDYFKSNWVDDQVKPALGKVEITNNGKSISWGAMYWQYTEQLDKITSSNTNIHLERKYFIEKQSATGPVLTAVDAQHTPKTGDLLKVVVYLKADRDFEYVQLKDMRPAGTEPVDVLSSYKYQDGLYYYQVTKDVATNFFISRLNKGSYVFEYMLRVVQPGNYSTGISSIQSMYAPEFSAHSEGMRMVIVK